MELTQEQIEVINSVNDDNKIIKVESYAGGSKSTCAVNIAKKIRETDKISKILYIVFNKAMAEDARRRFKGLDVTVTTTHAFCLKRLTAVDKQELTIMNNIDYNDYMMIKNKNSKYKWCKYKNISDMFNSFCLTFDNFDKFKENILKNPAIYRLEGNNIRSIEIDFFTELYKYFISKRKFLHNMYVKEYAVNRHDKIKINFLIADEQQDCNALMVSVLKRFDCKKMWMFYDRYQAIYKFNACIDASKCFEGKRYPLSVSFRFPENVKDLCNDILSSHYPEFPRDIKCFHNNTEVKDKTKKTLLFRYNATLIEKAIQLCQNKTNKVKFMDVVNGEEAEGFDNIFSDMIYLFDQMLEAKGSKILYDFRQKFNVRYSKNIEKYKNIAKKENVNFYNFIVRNKNILSLDLAKYLRLFLDNENNIVEVLDNVRNSEELTEYDMLYELSTVHGYKGKEASWIELCDDKWSLSNSEEVNICYVACSRAVNFLQASPIIELLNEKLAFK